MGRFSLALSQTTCTLMDYYTQNVSSGNEALVLQSMFDSEVEEQKRVRVFLASAQKSWDLAAWNYARTNFDLIDAT